MFRRLTGLIAATHTPLLPNGAVQLERIPLLVDHLLQDRVDGLYVLGSTGEGVSLSTAERLHAAEAFLQAAAGRVPVIVQVGHNSVTEAAGMARHAAQHGATAISATPPSYFKPNSPAALVECMAPIAQGAPGLPFYYYHISSVTGVTVDMVAFLELAGSKIPNFAGLKFTAPTLWEYQACVELDHGRFDVLYGTDEMLFPAWCVGARGAVGSTYNFAAPLYRKILKACEQGDFTAARQLQSQSIAFVRILLKFGGLTAIKAVMAMVGFDCGPVRPPLHDLTSTERTELRLQLQEIGFFQWARETA